MQMKIQYRQVDNITVLDLAGRIVLGEGSELLRDAILGCLAEGKSLILLNLANVAYVDSSGLGQLVVCLSRIRNGNGELKLLNLTEKVQDVLQITKLYTIFEVYDNEAAAIESFPQKTTPLLIAD